jgi:hypothetical protein
MMGIGILALINTGAEMTIKSARIFLQYVDKNIARKMNGTHFGFMYWAEKRIQAVKQQMRGPEVRGINLVNFFIHDFDISAEEFMVCGDWRQVANSIEIRCRVRLDDMIERDPIENITLMLPNMIDACSKASWPQVRAMGLCFSRTEIDKVELGRFLNKWSNVVFPQDARSE